MASTSSEAPPSNFQLSLSKSMAGRDSIEEIMASSDSTEAPPSLPSQTSTINTSTKAKSKCSMLSLVANFKVNFCVSKHKVQLDSTKTKSKCSIRYLVANFKAKFGVSKPKPPEDIIIANAKKDDPHVGAPSASSKMISDDLGHLRSAWEVYMYHMNMQIKQADEKFRELQRLGSSEGEFDKLQKAIAKLKFQIPLTSNKDDNHGGDLSPTSRMIHSDLRLVDSALEEAKESIYHMTLKINKAHEKFKDLQISQRTDELRKADSDEKRKAESAELLKDIAKLRVQIRSHCRIRSTGSNRHPNQWPNINGVEEGIMHFFHKEPEVEPTSDFDGLSKTFDELPQPLRSCLLCFFKFPREAFIKRTTMIYLWIGQGYISLHLSNKEEYPQEREALPVEEDAGKNIFDELIAKHFIEPCPLEPNSCRMNLSVRSSLREKAKELGFTSNGNLDLDVGFDVGDLDGHSCLINIGEAIIDYKPEIFENMKNIRSLHLGVWQSSAEHDFRRWQSSAEHHVELADTKIFHGLKKLNNLTFLSLRGISMITELPALILELQNLKILDLRACHNLKVIPDNISLLKRLTHLDMSECYFLEHMPKSLAQLSNLEVLKGFFVGDVDNNKRPCTLYDLSKMLKLRKLNIYTSVKDFPRMRDLRHFQNFKVLQKLTISWGGCSLHSESHKKNEEDYPSFEQAEGPLTLPRQLQKLDLQCFPGASRPNWLRPASLMQLKKLYIRGGKLCDLGQLRNHQWEHWTVEILRLKYLSKLQIEWSELRRLFPELIYLHQVECPNLTNFRGYKNGVWMDKKAIDARFWLQKLFRTHGISLSSLLGYGPK